MQLFFFFFVLGTIGTILKAVRERIQVTEDTLESDDQDECKKIVDFKRKCDLLLEPLPKKIELVNVLLNKRAHSSQETVR